MMNTSLTNSTLTDLELFIQSITSPSVLFFYIINLFLGLPLNVYVVILLIRAGKLDGAVIFSFSQSISEILFALQLPLCVLCLVNRRNLCFLAPATFISNTCMSARFYFQSCVCFERYLAVVHPVTFLKYKSVKYRLACAAVIWIYSFLYGIMSIQLFNLSFPGLGVVYVISLILHLYLCFSILRVLRKPPPGEGGKKDGGVSVAKKKAFALVSFSLLIFLFQTIPLAVVSSAKDDLSHEVFSLVLVIMLDFNIAAGIALPVLILHQMGKLTFLRCA